MATKSRYDDVKQFNGKRYTGMQVGRSHKWRYDAGEWKERKVTPDRWEFRYAVVKRRAGRAPEGSGAPVGTAYHWYIVADQVVTKLDANSYMTEMVGHKLKLGHRRAERSTWNASDRAQRKQLVKLLRELIVELEAVPADAEVVHAGKDAPKNGAAKNGAAKNGAAKNGAAKNGAAKNGAAKNGARTPGARRGHTATARRTSRGHASTQRTQRRSRVGAHQAPARHGTRASARR
jgi:hypothetical protein